VSEELNFVMQARRDKLDRMRAANIEPYAYSYDRTHTAAEAVTALGDREEGPAVSVAGRLVSWRSQGKTAFAHLADMDGRVQLYFRRDDLGESAWAGLADYDLGDWVGAQGTMMRTRTGEATVRVANVTMLSKSLRSLPFGKEAVVDGETQRYSTFSDTEQRARQRYADLAVHPERARCFAPVPC
jgi:lysyl-tRNA synthetase class 2